MARYHNTKEVLKIGEQITKLRESKNFSVEDIAAMTGFSRSTISRVEKGNESNTTHLIEIAKAIGVHPKEVFNVDFEIKPRFKLSGKRKEQQKLTMRIRTLISSGFFRSPKSVSDVSAVLKESSNIKANGVHLSGILRRFSSEGRLKYAKIGRKNVYSNK